MVSSEEAITVNLNGKISECSQTQNSTHAQTTIDTLNYVHFYTKRNTLRALLGFSGTLRHVLITDTQVKSR